jgi:fructose-1,6-bisphosphatase
LYIEEELKVEDPKQDPKLFEYREQILKGIQQHSSYKRTQIRKCYPKQYMFLYRHDKEWLFEQLPVKRKKEDVNEIVNWTARDNEYHSEI